MLLSSVSRDCARLLAEVEKLRRQAQVNLAPPDADVKRDVLRLIDLAESIVAATGSCIQFVQAFSNPLTASRRALSSSNTSSSSRSSSSTSDCCFLGYHNGRSKKRLASRDVFLNAPLDPKRRHHQTLGVPSHSDSLACKVRSGSLKKLSSLAPAASRLYQRTVSSRASRSVHLASVRALDSDLSLALLSEPWGGAISPLW
jgi:hypothetical protein